MSIDSLQSQGSKISAYMRDQGYNCPIFANELFPGVEFCKTGTYFGEGDEPRPDFMAHGAQGTVIEVFQDSDISYDENNAPVRSTYVRFIYRDAAGNLVPETYHGGLELYAKIPV